MTNIREKIESRASNDNAQDRDYLNRALMRMSWIILAGYLIGTGIAHDLIEGKYFESPR